MSWWPVRSQIFRKQGRITGTLLKLSHSGENDALAAEKGTLKLEDDQPYLKVLKQKKKRTMVIIQKKGENWG